MEIFNFENNFDIEVNHSKTETFTKLETYIRNKNWNIIHVDPNEFVSFYTKTISITITFIAINDNSTTLSITTKTEQFDYNKNVGVIHKILKECFSEEVDNIEEGNAAVQYSDTKSKPKKKNKQKHHTTNDNESKRKLAFVASIAFLVIMCIYPSVSSYIKEYSSSPAIEYTYESDTYSEPTYNEPKRTEKKDEPNQPSWLIGSWRCPLGPNGVLIVNIYGRDAEVKIMNGFTMISKIEYDGWTVLYDMLYLCNNGERLADSPSFFIDFENRTIIGHTGERFQKH